MMRGTLDWFPNRPGHPSSSFYASLTGPGESTTPGDLTQDGGFTITDSEGHGITFTSTNDFSLTVAVAIFLNAFNLSLVASNEAILTGSFGGGVGEPSFFSGLTWTAADHSTVVQGAKNGFYGHGAVHQQTLLGDISAITDANAKTVLANLANLLAATGLLINGTT